LYGGRHYWKIDTLTGSTDWHQVTAQLDPTHGIRPLRWSLLSTLEIKRVRRCIEPRTAVRRGVRQRHGHDCGQRQLRDLLAALDDPGNRHGHLGLTGSAALSQIRLCDAEDLDLLLYPSLPADALRWAIRQCGGQFLADLQSTDARYRRYADSRTLPATPTQHAQAKLWARRYDVAWLGDTRIDLTAVPSRPTILDELPYAATDLGPFHDHGVVATVVPGYPVWLHLHAGSSLGRTVLVLVTARGYDGVFRPGDHIVVSGRRRGSPERRPFVSVEDWPGHGLALRA
jgi:hypothetical protein